MSMGNGKQTEEVREDEEQRQRRQDCIDLLIASGYFRARIQGLSDFDKIVGGMAWCITVCDQSLDADVLFSENSTIGQKIALTEKIVEVLLRLKCPYILEPHQIQGLDFIHIYPTIQWLVKQATEAREAHQAALEQHADFQCGRDFSESATLNRFVQLTKNAGFLTEDVESDIRIIKDGIQGVDVSTEKLEGKPDEDELVKLQLLIEETKKENLKLEEELNEEQRLQEVVSVKHGKLLSDQEDYNRIINSVTPQELEELTGLLSDYRQMQSREKEFKAFCRSELVKLDSEIEILNSMDSSETNGTEYLVEELQNTETELSTRRAQLALINQRVAKLQRMIDSVPSPIEVAQYQQRFIELYNQMSHKHRQTRQYYTLHNTLLDVKNYMDHEIKLLTQIEDVLPMATKDTYRDSFCQNLQEIFRNVETNFEQLSGKNDKLEKTKDELIQQLNKLKEEERMFSKISREFLEACRLNETLHSSNGN